MSKYLDFMDDDKLLQAIENLYITYIRSFTKKTLKELNKNIIDPFKFQFDTVFLNQGNAVSTMNSEIFRQSDKSISNAIGVFHQQLIGSIYGFCETPELPCDVKKCDNTIFVEVKNKHNTMNVRSSAGVYEELEGLAKSYPNATCYLVEIIAKKSADSIWIHTVNEKKISHPRIHKISADRFYELATGNEDAFKQLCNVLPKAIKDFIEHKEKSNIYQTFKTNKMIDEEYSDNEKILSDLFYESFKSYNGFHKHTLLE